MVDEMRAWVFDGDRTMRIETRPVPEPGPGEVRLRVARVGICGSDVHGYAGESGFRLPGIVMGHEASALVDAVGPGVAGLDPGEPVTFAPTLPCDGSCGHETPNRCEHMRLIGVTPGLPGAFADFMVLPASRVFRLGSVSLEQGSTVEPLAVGLHSARQAGVRAGDDVLVLGGGMIGQAAGIGARLEGAATVTISDPIESRRRVAEAYGFLAIAPEELEGRPYFDCAVDAVGIPQTLTAAIKAVARGRSVSLVGLGLPRAEIRMYDVIGHERSIVGSSCYTDEEFQQVIDAHAAGQIDLQPLSQIGIPFDEVGNSIEALANGSETAVKVTMSTAVSA